MVRVIFFPVGGEPHVKDVPDELENWQAEVGGYIESVNLGNRDPTARGLLLICNEDGMMLKLPVNPHMGVFGRLFGNYIVTRVNDEGQHVDVTEADIERFLYGSVKR